MIQRQTSLWSFFQNELNDYQYILNSLRIIRQESIFNSYIEFRLNNIRNKTGIENSYFSSFLFSIS
ncbi:MAG: hypothetical protein A2X13_08970 [Bacteroidetes bacterium GWC2_33_15]|nr:MAG: hypothetical protein A2X10_01600 [Bacteroidetes bacterium GWA2_33_15]OFX49083.1 MAG: hypothetical protein A2X13_08970 [Bacteroidetes bacterium GWC2_33_15]HAN17403.1 hypothetical protein [Bacteroidales bacterium]